jgi:hypothetical protein
VLVVLSFLLLLAATVLLVLGLVAESGGLSLVYMSMACSAAAALTLFVALRLARPREVAWAAGPSPIPEPDHERSARETVGVPVAGRAEPSPEPPAPVTAAAPAATEEEEDWLADEQAWDESDWSAAELEFPIADYDDLTSAQILPLLPKLYSDELVVVEERERQHLARSEILDRIGELRRQGGAWDDDDWFPIEDYDLLSIPQILPLLPQLEPDELEVVRAHEVEGPRRDVVLDEIGRLLGSTPAPPVRAAEPELVSPATAEPEPEEQPTGDTAKRTSAPKDKPRATKKSPAKKKAAATKRTPAKKTAAAKRAAPAKKKAAPVKKAAAKRTPAKKTAAPAKKTTARKQAAPRKKATPPG